MPRFGVSMTRSGKQLEATAAANFDANGQEKSPIIGTILAGLTRSDLDSIAGNQVPSHDDQALVADHLPSVAFAAICGRKRVAIAGLPSWPPVGRNRWPVTVQGRFPLNVFW